MGLGSGLLEWETENGSWVRPAAPSGPAPVGGAAPTAAWHEAACAYGASGQPSFFAVQPAERAGLGLPGPAYWGRGTKHCRVPASEGAWPHLMMPFLTLKRRAKAATDHSSPSSDRRRTAAAACRGQHQLVPTSYPAHGESFYMGAGQG